MNITNKFLVIAVALLLLTGKAPLAFAQTHEFNQKVGSTGKICVDLGSIFGHACSPDIHILAEVSERIEFKPDPDATVRVQIAAPVKFDSGWQGISNGKICRGISNVSFLGQGVRDCTQVNHITETEDKYSFHLVKSIEVGYSFPVIGTHRHEFTYFDHSYSVTRID